MNAKFFDWKSNDKYTSEFFPLYSLSSIRKIFWQENRVVTQSFHFSCRTKQLCEKNVHIDLDNWPINLLSNFVLQIACMM